MTSLVYPTGELSINPSIVADSLALSGINLHQRNSSNPFEVIYDDARPSHTRTNSNLWHNSYNYEEISKIFIVKLQILQYLQHQ